MPTAPRPSPLAVEAAARRVLAEGGPIHVDDLLDRLEAFDLGGPTAVEDILDGVLDGDAFVELPGDIVADVPSLLDGGPFTHRLSAEEIAADALRVEPDLLPLARLDDVDGGPALRSGDAIAHRHIDFYGAPRACA